MKESVSSCKAFFLKNVSNGEIVSVERQERAFTRWLRSARINMFFNFFGICGSRTFGALAQLTLPFHATQ